MTNSTLVSPVKMEYGWNFSISGLMMKSGVGKIFLKFLHVLTMLFLLLNLYFWSKFSNKNDMVSTWRNFKNMQKFHPYSILTGDTRVEFVIYCVLKPFCFVFPPFTDKVVFSYYASWVMFFTRPWSHLTWIFQWSFRVTAESRKLADKLHTMNSCFQILHRSVDAKGSTQCIFVQNWYSK